MSEIDLIKGLLAMDVADRNILTGLLNLMQTETDPGHLADVLDDIYFIIAQAACSGHTQELPGGKNSLDGNMYYLHRLRDIFAGQTNPV